MTAYTRDQVIAMAPDAASVKAAQKLLNPAKWQLLEQDDLAIWAECKGSGQNPYLVQIECAEPAFKCSCPSRKFPCKHGLALLLLHAEDSARFTVAASPPRVSEWLESRAGRAEKKAARVAKKKTRLADPEKLAKQAAKRRSEMEAGLVDFERWLQDLIRQGLAAAPGRGPSYWTDPAARLVDAKAPGMASWVRRMQWAARSGEGWPERLLGLAGQAYLLRRAFTRFDELPLGAQGDVRAALGWPADKDMVLAGDSVRERMRVVGASLEERERLRERRIWLQSEATGKAALVLDFAHGQQPFGSLLSPGSTVDLELAYYPSGAPLRAVVKQQHGEAETMSELHGAGTIEEGLQGVADFLASNPWMNRLPLALGSVYPARFNESFILEDSNHRYLKLDPAFERGWSLLAHGGGRPVAVFGEWRNEALLPLGCVCGSEFLNLALGDTN